MKKLIIAFAAIDLLYFAAKFIVPTSEASQRISIKSSPAFIISKEAQAVYNRLDFIANLH